MEGRHRVGILAELPDVLREFGKNSRQVIGRAGIDPDVLRDPENVLSFIEVGRLLHTCVMETGCQHLGLMLGQRASTSSLGLVGRLMQNAPTLGAAMLDLCTNQARYIHGAVVYLATRNEMSYWGYAVYVPGMQAVVQLTDGAVAVGTRLARELAGVTPEAVYLTGRAPPELGPYRRCFGVTPQFEAEQCALVFPATVLTRPVRGADRELRRILSKSVAEYWAVRQPSMSDRVMRVLRARMMFGDVSLDTVADELGVHSRTLNRRLQADNASFRSLLNKARFEVAGELLKGTRMTVTDLALVLGYADTSAFTHAFQRWAGLSPSEWRVQRDPTDGWSVSLR